MLKIFTEELYFLYRVYWILSPWKSVILVVWKWEYPGRQTQVETTLNICNGCGMPTEDAYSSGHLVLSHFGTCKCSNVETNISWTCLFLDFWVSNIPRYFCFPWNNVELPCWQDTRFCSNKSKLKYDVASTLCIKQVVILHHPFGIVHSGIRQK